MNNKLHNFKVEILRYKKVLKKKDYFYSLKVFIL